MPTIDNPYDKLRVLLERVQGEVESIPGLKMVQHEFVASKATDLMRFTVIMDPAIVFAPEPPVVVIPDDAVTVDREAFDAEQAGFDAQFAALANVNEFETLVADVKDDDLAQSMRDAAAEARENLKSLRDDEGLGFDG